MSRVLRVVPVLLLAFVLGGCTGGAATTTSTPGSSRVVAAAEAGADVGNDRPQVTYDGLMVRRRVVIAIRPTPGADLVSLRKELDREATRSHTTLSTIPPGVLDPGLWEQLAPDLVMALPAGETLSDARRLFDPASVGGRNLPEVAELQVTPVLVHDLRFTASSANPAALAAAIAREGILSDALGNYTTTPGRGELDIAYTGPLLSDDLVELVRRGIARRAGIESSAVMVSPRSTGGAGVDMAKEPAPAPVNIEGSTAHKDHNAALPTVRAASLSSPPESSRSSTLWSVSVVALPLLLILTLALLLMKRFSQPFLPRPKASRRSANKP